MVPSSFNNLTTPLVESPHILKFEASFGAASTSFSASSFKLELNREMVRELCINMEEFRFREQ